MAILTLKLQKEVGWANVQNLVQSLQQMGWTVGVEDMELHPEEEGPYKEFQKREAVRKAQLAELQPVLDEQAKQNLKEAMALHPDAFSEGE